MKEITDRILELINDYELESSYPFENARYLYLGYEEYDALRYSLKALQYINMDGRYIVTFRDLEVVRVQLPNHLNISA